METKFTVRNMPKAINPDQLAKLIQFLLTVLPGILTLFRSPNPDPVPPPVQSGPMPQVSVD